MVLDPIVSGTSTALTSAGMDNPTGTQVLLNYQNTRSFLITGFYVLTSFVVALTWITSFVDRHNWVAYLFNLVALLIITPVLIYMVATFWQQISIMGLPLNVIRVEFVANWAIILTINFFLGLLSFLFVPKGAPV
jgi:hypothetical protein